MKFSFFISKYKKGTEKIDSWSFQQKLNLLIWLLNIFKTRIVRSFVLWWPIGLVMIDTLEYLR